MLSSNVRRYEPRTLMRNTSSALEGRSPRHDECSAMCALPQLPDPRAVDPAQGRVRLPQRRGGARTCPPPPRPRSRSRRRPPGWPSPARAAGPSAAGRRARSPAREAGPPPSAPAAPATNTAPYLGMAPRRAAQMQNRERAVRRQAPRHSALAIKPADGQPADPPDPREGRHHCRARRAAATCAKSKLPISKLSDRLPGSHPHALILTTRRVPNFKTIQTSC